MVREDRIEDLRREMYHVLLRESISLESRSVVHDDKFGFRQRPPLFSLTLSSFHPFIHIFR